MEVNGARVERAQRSRRNHVVAAVHADNFLAGPGLGTEGFKKSAHPCIHDLVGAQVQLFELRHAAAEHAMCEGPCALYERCFF